MDLFSDDLGNIPSADLYRAALDFLRLDAPSGDRPAEGWKFDFKREWNDKALRAVAGFANTFGGILILGIDPDPSDTTRPGHIIPKSGSYEVKLQAASSIASNISPMPWYRTTECADPNDPNKRICIVQIRAGTALHLLTKGTSNPVYVRNENGCLPADAARLRALIAERIEAPKQPSNLPSRAARMWSDLYVTRPSASPSTQRSRSATYFLLSALPNRSLVTRLDRALEGSFQRIIEREFPKMSTIDHQLTTIAEINHAISRDRYEMQMLHGEIDFERRWAVRSNGDFGFVSQPGRSGPNNQQFWSLSDITIETIACFNAVLRYWRDIDFTGEFVVAAYLALPGLTLLRRQAYPAGFASVFYGRENSMDSRILTTPPSSLVSQIGPAEIETNTVETGSKLAENAAVLLNQLLRCQGYSVDFGLLIGEVQRQVDFIAAWRNNPESFHIAPCPSVQFLSAEPNAPIR